MIIGINALSIFPGISGGGQTYVENLLKSLSLVDLRNKYILFVNDINQSLFPQNERFIKIICPVSKKNLFFRVIWEQFILPFYVKKYKIDLLFSPTNISPIFWLPCKSILNICDVYWAHFGEHFSKIEYLLLKYLISISVLKADKVITISEYTKQEVIKYTGAREQCIQAIYLGRGNLLKPLIESDSSKNTTLSKIGDKYLLAVGRTHAHKNYLNLIEAFKLLQKNSAFTYKLVIAGIPGRQHKELEDKIKSEKLGHEVFLLGRVDEGMLFWLYKNAEVFIFPSIYEGFGLPLLEAMSFGLPIACSNVSALPEIGGDAVLCFDPLDVRDIAGKIDTLLNSGALKKELIRKGIERVKHFTWENTARKTMAVFKDVYNNA